jgi:PhnB protein
MTHNNTENVIQEVFPYLRVRDANSAIEFYKRVFQAQETFRMAEPNGRIGHAQLKIGPATVMLSEEYPEKGILSPLAFGGTGSFLHLHVTDVDAMTKTAAEAGARITMEPKTQFYGERNSKLVDPFGHEWMLGQHVEDVSPEEMQRRYAATFSKAE